MAESPGSSRGAGTERLRRENTSAVLRSLRQDGPASRADLAKRTGLAKATVGVIVAGLEEAGAVVDGEVRTGARGRPGRPVVLSGERHWGLGLELNVDYVSAVALDLAGEVLHSESWPVEPDRAVEESSLVELALDVTRKLRKRHLVGVTVAVPGLVRADNRSVAWAPNVHAEGQRLASRLGQVVSAPVRVSNDANCAAYAEAHHGAARDVDHALYLTGTVGIGAGIIEGGDLVRGVSGFAGEVGHLPIGNPEARCGCGRLGCWEASIGLHAMLAAVGMPELETPLESAEAVATRASGDPAVRRTLEALGHQVGLGLAILAGVLDPAVVVLGGYFVPLGDLILAPASRAIDDRLASPAQRRPELRLSELGIQAAALGAAEQSFADVFSGDIDL